MNIPEYHKIQTVFKRDMENNPKLVLEGQWTTDEFFYLADCPWEWTEKIDGTNIRIGWDGNDMEIRGRTDKAQLNPKLIEAINALVTPESLAKAFPKDEERDQPPEITLYGEGYGPKIQKGGKYRDDMSFILFDVRIESWWLKRVDVVSIASTLGIDIVPYMGGGSLLEAIEAIKSGVSSRFGDFLAEGYVLRPAVDLRDRAGRRIITKLKHRDFGVEA